MAIFETSKSTDETDSEEDKADKKEQAKTLQPRQVEGNGSLCGKILLA